MVIGLLSSVNVLFPEWILPKFIPRYIVFMAILMGTLRMSNSIVKGENKCDLKYFNLGSLPTKTELSAIFKQKSETFHPDKCPAGEKCRCSTTEDCKDKQIELNAKMGACKAEIENK